MFTVCLASLSMLLCLKLKLLPIDCAADVLLIEQSITNKETFALVEFTKTYLHFLFSFFFFTVSNKKKTTKQPRLFSKKAGLLFSTNTF